MSHVFVPIEFQPTRKGLCLIISPQKKLICFIFLGLQYGRNESGFVDFFATLARIRFSVPKKGNVQCFVVSFIVIYVLFV